jgi:hypothetical protein
MDRHYEKIHLKQPRTNKSITKITIIKSKSLTKF